MQIVFDAVMDFADGRFLHGKLLFLLPERGHVLHDHDAAQKPTSLENRKVAPQKHEPARLDFLFRRTLRLHRLPRDMTAELRRVKPHAEQRAHAEHAENVLGGGVGIDNPFVCVGNQHTVPRRKRTIRLQVESAARILQDHARRVDEAGIAALLKLPGGYLKTDDGNRVHAVMNAVGVHFEAVGTVRSAAEPDQRLSGQKRFRNQRLRRCRDKRADRRKTKRLHHRMGTRLRQHEELPAVPRRRVQACLRLRKISDKRKPLADIFQQLRLPPADPRMRPAKPTDIVHIAAPFQNKSPTAPGQKSAPAPQGAIAVIYALIEKV